MVSKGYKIWEDPGADFVKKIVKIGGSGSNTIKKNSGTSITTTPLVKSTKIGGSSGSIIWSKSGAGGAISSQSGGTGTPVEPPNNLNLTPAGQAALKLLYAEANWNDDDDDYLDIHRRPSTAMQAIEERYGITFANHHGDTYDERNPPPEWNRENVLAVYQGLRLIENALRQNAPSQSQTGNSNQVLVDMRNRFEGVELFVGSGRNVIAALALGGAEAVVPPPGLGGTGKQVYFREGLPIDSRTVIHEFGHVVDFDLGSGFNRAGINLESPSTRFAVFTGGSLNPPPLCDHLFWGLCVGARLGSGYAPGGTPPQYGYGDPPDQLEDFAESWTQWILSETNDPRSRALDRSRYEFMEANVPQFFGD